MLEREKKEIEKMKLAAEEDDDELTIEEKIEEERAALPSEGLIPVTLETFNDWKRRKAEKKQKELEDRMKEEAKKAGGKGGSGILSGRALFKFDPSVFQDDEAAADSAVYEERAEDEEDAPVKEEEVESEGEERKEAEEVDKELFQQEEGQQEEEPDFD